MALIYSFPTGVPIVEHEQELRNRPICNFCGHHIQEEYGYNILGVWICEDCVRGFREDIKD